jgi:hypothetical protein
MWQCGLIASVYLLSPRPASASGDEKEKEKGNTPSTCVALTSGSRGTRVCITTTPSFSSSCVTFTRLRYVKNRKRFGWQLEGFPARRRVSIQVTWWASRQHYKRRPGRRTRQVACMVCEVEIASAKVTIADKASARLVSLVHCANAILWQPGCHTHSNLQYYM